MQRKAVPPAICGRRTREIDLGNASTMKIDAGMSDRKIRSNKIVKSKSSRHPWTDGPKEPS